MPFTFSHPAIILPLLSLPKRWVSTTGLAIGTMAPDFEYFLRMKVVSIHSHTFGGIFYFDLPIGLVIAFIFHLIIRNALIDNLPQCVYKRLYKFKEVNWQKYFRKYYITIIGSIIIGALTHLIWDSFTHPEGYFTRIFPFLKKEIIVGWLNVPLYKILQHTSSLIGAASILIYFFLMPVLPLKHNHQISFKFWFLAIGVTLTILLCKLIFGFNIKQYGHIIVTGIMAVFIGILVASSLYYRAKQF